MVPLDIEVVKPRLRQMYIAEMESNITWKLRWRSISSACLAASKVLVGAATVCDFVAGSYQNADFTFAAGCVNTLGLVLIGFSSWARAESKKRNAELTRLLSSFDIPLPPSAASSTTIL